MTAGFDNARTSYNANANLTLPLALAGETLLDGVDNAQSLLAFDGFLLVGEVRPEVVYHLFDAATGQRLWTWESGGEISDITYVPALGQDVVLLGGGGVLAAVRVSDGTELWRDESVGLTVARFPIIAGDLAFYHGENGVVAALAKTGEEIWRRVLPTQTAPISLLGSRVYILGQDFKLHALNIFDGSDVWASDPLPGLCACSITATENKVFVTPGGFSSPARFMALDAATGGVEWDEPGVPFGAPPSSVLAQGLLITAGGGQGGGRIVALKPDTGALVYEKAEKALVFTPIPTPLPTFFHRMAAGKTFVYFNLDLAIQFRDLKSGELVWTIDARDLSVRGLSLAGSSLYVLLPDRVRVYRSSFERFVPHFAAGQGQSTLLALANDSVDEVRGHLEFFNSEGAPINVAVEGLNENDPAGFRIPSRTSLHLTTIGSDQLRSGWIRLMADGPLSVSSIYRAVGAAESGSAFEAGVADARPQTEATVPASVRANLNTAIALANPLPFEVKVTLTITGPGTEATAVILLQSHAHVARFVDEIFPDEAGVGFEGTLRIDSEFPITATALRTQDGLQLSSLPVGR